MVLRVGEVVFVRLEGIGGGIRIVLTNAGSYRAFSRKSVRSSTCCSERPRPFGYQPREDS